MITRDATSSSHALCLNPLGCAPQTQGECIKDAKSARTESAARVLISECRKLPKNTEAECRKLTNDWARYLQATNGVEWNWPRLPEKADCMTHYASSFSAATWVTAQYCDLNSNRLIRAAAEIDSASKQSKRLQDVRRREANLNDLSDRSVVEVLHKLDYSDMLPEEIAAALFIDSPPDILEVQRSCTALVGTKKVR